MKEVHDSRQEYLGELGMELLTRGLDCELMTTGTVPRLRLGLSRGWRQDMLADTAFEDNVIAAKSPDGRWRFWWPWVQPIGPADDPAGAADHIIRNTLGTPTDDDEETIRR